MLLATTRRLATASRPLAARCRLRRFVSSETENRVLCKNIELAARSGDLTRVRSLLDGAASVPSVVAEVKRTQQRVRSGVTVNAILLYLIASGVLNAGAAELAKRLVGDEANELLAEGISGEVVLQMTSFSPSASLSVRLDQPVALEDEDEDGDAPVSSSGRPPLDLERRRSPEPTMTEDYQRARTSLNERLLSAVRDVARLADSAMPNGARVRDGELTPGGVVSAAVAAPDGVSPARRVTMVPLIYVTDLLLGRSEWVLRCRVEDDGSMRWKSKMGVWTSEWVTLTAVGAAGGPASRSV